MINIIGKIYANEFFRTQNSHANNLELKTNSKWILNLTNTYSPKNVEHFLSLGHDFCINDLNKKKVVEDTLANIESNIKVVDLQLEKKDEFRSEMTYELQTFLNKKPKQGEDRYTLLNKETKKQRIILNKEFL